MMYECDYFKVVSCPTLNDTPRGGFFPPIPKYTTYLDLAGKKEATGVGGSRVEALFAAFANALGPDIARCAEALPRPAASKDYHAEWRAVADLFHVAAKSADRKIVRLPLRDETSARPEAEKKAHAL